MNANAPVLTAPDAIPLCPEQGSASPPSKRRRKASAPVTDAPSATRFVFVELFAGKGGLTKRVAKVVETLQPQDFADDGVDFRDLQSVQTLWSRWQGLADQGMTILFHVAPPCATFSRARDRSHKTRLRSLAIPGGWYPDDIRTQEANLIAKHTALTVNCLVGRLGAAGTWEQPAGSYMFPYLEQEGFLTVDPDNVVLLHQCKFGQPWKTHNFHMFWRHSPPSCGQALHDLFPML